VIFVPEADFSADNLTPGIGETVNFTDLSTNNPTSWAWTFTPSTITYVGGTTSSSQNPEVQFDAGGNYTIELTATNISGSDTETKIDYIYASIPYIDLEITVFLEGPFNISDMNSDLITYLPLNQPYNIDPWFYPGTENVAAIPGLEIVDWILVELRNATSASQAVSATIFDRQAAFLRSDGVIVDLNGNPVLHFESSVADSLYVVIHQRNHLSIMTAFGLEENGGIYAFDFTQAVEQAYGSAAQKLIGTGIWGMYSGDGNRDGQVETMDKSPLWDNEAGSNGYLYSDYNLDSESDNIDKNTYWVPNIGEGSQVPN
ncbi:MAG: PKD domain-containing protein, partial [Bacteroidales bacterium]|nr:PKD domain-containing protein [Bacteroidales bacterium]